VGDKEPATARRSPCASCPYRVDVASGVWHETEYEKLRDYDGEIGEQKSLKAFYCHHADGRVCSGWLAHRDPADLLAVRLGISIGTLHESVVDHCTTVPLFASGAEAADHGEKEIKSPSEKATQTIAKIVKVSETRSNREVDK
jgi:hypothetical protein